MQIFQAEDGIRDQPRSRGLGDVYKRQTLYKYPIIPFLFYGAALVILIGGLFYVFKSFNIA